MPLNVVEAIPVETITPYLAWGELLERSLDRRERIRIGARFWRPVFVQAKDALTTGPQLIEALQGVDGVRIDVIEREIANRRRAESSLADPADAVIHVPAGWTFAEDEHASRQLREICHVIHLGLAIPQPTELTVNPPATRGDPPATKVMAGLIDDGIAFLNARFRDGDRTRIAGLWLQTLGQTDEGDPPAIQVGHRLGPDDINRLLAKVPALGEAEVYRELYASVPVLRRGVPAGVERTVLQAASHGTHMLDTMAGAAPFGPADARMRAIPIIAAQLPPQSVDDTTGANLEVPIVQALRWIIHTAIRHKAERLVVNLSFGVTAGAKDGTRFIEQQMAKEIARARASGLTVDIVLPFGNEGMSRMLQRFTLISTATAEVKIPREDLTPTYIELRSIGNEPLEGNVLISVEAPTGERTNPIPIPVGQMARLTWDNRTFGRIHHVRERQLSPHYDPQRAYILFAFAPTSEVRGSNSQTDDVVLTRPGRWKIHLSSPNGVPLDLTLQIQRDDSAYGYNRQGEQARFDAPGAHAPDEWSRTSPRLPEGQAITSAGTNSDYVTRNTPGVHAIAAARQAQCDPSPAPTDYGSRGADWSGGNPDGAVVVDTSDVFLGTPASANMSGSQVWLNGSSVASAAHARHLLMMAIDAAPAVAAGEANRPPVHPDQQDRLGLSVLAPDAAGPRPRV